MAMIDRNFTFATNGTVTANDLHNLIDSATIYQNLITGQQPITSVGTNYELLIADGTNPNAAPNAVTVYDLFEDALTAGTYSNANISAALTYGTATGTRLVSTNATITTGTITTAVIPTLTAGTTTSTAATITSGTITNLASTTGTIATLNSTTGTIPTLVATTLITTGTGTDATPAIVPTGDTNTGIFFPAADTIAFSEGGAEAMRINSSGNVGIGTTSPGGKLDVFGDGHFQNIEVGKSGQTGNRNAFVDFVGDDTYSDYGLRIIRQNSGANASTVLQTRGTGGLFLRTEEAGDIVLQTTNTERLRIDASGKVGIGTTSPATKLDVFGDGHFQNIELGKAGQTGNRNAFVDFVGDDTYSDYGLRIIRQNSGANASTVLQTRGTGGLFLRTEEAGDIVLQTTNTERLRIDAANGTLTSQPTYDNTGSGSAVIVTSAGLVRRTSSSIKYKKDIENLYGSIVDNAISNLRPVWYRTKNPEGDDKSTWSHVGLIAEEVNSVEPRLVKYKTVEVSIGENGERIETQLENPIPEDVDYAKLSVILLSEVKAQKAKIASLEARIEALEAA